MHPPPGPLTPAAGVNRLGAGSAGHPRATRRFGFDRSASTLAGTTSIPNKGVISWQVIDPCPTGPVRERGEDALAPR
jgi:hypothetical protein